MTRRSRLVRTASAALCATALASLAAPRERVPLEVSPLADHAEAGPSAQIDLPAEAPATLVYHLRLPDRSWTDLAALEFEVFWPDPSPTNGQVMVQVTDWDYLWYQNLAPGYLAPGAWNRFRVDLSPGAAGWESRGHHAAWHLRALMRPEAFTVRVFCKRPAKGACSVAKVFGELRSPQLPYIRNVRASADRVACYGKFELTFEMPDKYTDPFDAEEVAVIAEFTGPGGELARVDGYYGRDYYRGVTQTGESVLPQGPPYWRTRFCPTRPGTYDYSILVRDHDGTARWGPATFEATDPVLPGFVRASQRDPRYFEFENGDYYFPIGHNIRSPYDARMGEQFPWRQRWPEGSSAYARYFADMQAHGENIAEVWTAAWSLGLEWAGDWPGYHGIGQYNMAHAWELDGVVDLAERHGVYVNLVVHNHGKFSGFSDEEWKHNPFNTANGGYLEKPEDYFTDPRAMKAFRKLMRYMVARWAFSTHIFAWEFWSELDLTGTSWQQKNHMRPETVDWHRLMGRAVLDMDPYDHMISTHVCGDYTHQNKAIISLPEIGLCPVNGYHGSTDPIQVVRVMQNTVNFNNPFNKPVLITEFGGSHVAQGLKHLDEGLHAGLWASTCLPVGGAPMFWWWQVLEEENLYPKYLALSRFMKGEDRRDPNMLTVAPALSSARDGGYPIEALCLKNRSRGLGWIFHTSDFGRIDASGPAVTEGVAMRVPGLAAGAYRVEFWDTVSGRRMTDTPATVGDNGELAVDVPAFARDIAFKVKPSE